jgi:transposase-like protein
MQRCGWQRPPTRRRGVWGRGMAKRRYSDEFRASAIVMLESQGYPDKAGAIAQVAAHLKMPVRTLRRWYKGHSNPAPANLVLQKKIDFLDVIETELAGIFEEMPEARADADYRTLATAAGILFDKRQLLLGKPTEHIQQSDGLTDDERAARIAAIFDAARTRRTG